MIKYETKDLSNKEKDTNRILDTSSTLEWQNNREGKRIKNTLGLTGYMVILNSLSFLLSENLDYKLHIGFNRELISEVYDRVNDKIEHWND